MPRMKSRISGAKCLGENDASGHDGVSYEDWMSESVQNSRDAPIDS